MNSVTPATGPPQPASQPRRPSRWRAVAGAPRRLLAGARRRPRQALLVVLAALGLLVGADALVGYLRFRHHLTEARDAADRWHNSAAVRHLSACLALRPDDPEALLLSARLARRAGTFPDAERFLDAYAAACGETDALVSERVLHRAARGETDEVAAALGVRIRAGGSPARLAREALVLGLVLQFRLREAHAVAEAWLREAPDDPVALLLRGKLFAEEQRIEQALEVLRRAVAIDPGLEDARLQLARLLVTRRRGEEALEELSVLRGRLPDHPEVAVLWAEALALQGRTDEARAALDECLAHSPDYPAALAERGNFALLDGDEEAAVRLLSRAVELDPGSLPARNKLALALRRVGKAAEADEQAAAIRQLEADSERVAELARGALRANPNDPNIHREIGLIALRGGQTREALRWFRSALAADPNHTPTHLTLAGVYKELGNPALEAKHRALAQRPAAPSPHGAGP